MARYYSESCEENDATIQLLRRAIASDPDFAPPYALAATAYVHRIGYGWSENVHEDREYGIRAARTAVRLDAGDPTVLALAGQAIGRLTDEYDLSLSLTDQALTLNPNSATALQLGGWARYPATCSLSRMSGDRLLRASTAWFQSGSNSARYSPRYLGSHRKSGIMSPSGSRQMSLGQHGKVAASDFR